MRRNTREVKAALELRPAVSPVQVLVVGNSLLDNGVLFDEASRSLRPDINAARLMVPDTNYYDWYLWTAAAVCRWLASRRRSSPALAATTRGVADSRFVLSLPHVPGP